MEASLNDFLGASVSIVFYQDLILIEPYTKISPSHSRGLNLLFR